MNRDWKHGYFTEGGYTYGYQPETAPSRLRWAAMLKGVKAPSSHFRYVDFGCGQGFGLLLHASQFPESEFVGIDFMPEHIAHAKNLAKIAGIDNVLFVEADFLDLLDKNEYLGSFDFAVAHGITTWVAPEVRRALFRLASGSLKPGGLMYNSYNTYPGSFSAQPFQHLVKQLKVRNNGLNAVSVAKNMMSEFNDAGSTLFGTFPKLQERLKSLETRDPSYLAQEYNNVFWQPAYSSEILALASQHKLEFLCSATLPESFDNCLPPKLLGLINREADPVLRETIRDLVTVQGFRRDIYVKGSFKYWPVEHRSAITDESLAHVSLLPIPRQGENFKFSGIINLEGDRKHYSYLLELFGADGATIGQVQTRAEGMELDRLIQSCSLLLHGGWLGKKAGNSIEAAQRLNKCILRAVLNGAPYRHLALGNVQAAIALSETEILILALCAENQITQDKKSLAIRFQGAMRSLNRELADGNGGVGDESRALAYSEMLAENFLKNGLPLYQALQVL
jgi:SAM-dependent methyltransferase